MSPEDNNPFDTGQAIGAARSLALLASRSTGDFEVAVKISKLLILISGSVATEAPPAGEFGRSSGQTPGRGSPVGNIKSPALSGAPVPAEDPVLTGDSGYIKA